MKFGVAASRFLQGRRLTIKVTCLFFLLGFLWIFLSHGLPQIITEDPVLLYRWQTAIDFSLVALSATGLALLIRRFLSLLHVQEKEIKLMIEGVCSATGEQFFTSLTENLAKITGAGYALIGEFTDENRTRVRTVAIFGNGKILENLEFDPQGTPCQEVVKGGIQTFPDRVRELFPFDSLAHRLEVDSYAGIPLHDSSGVVIGPMAIFTRGPLSNRRFAESMLQLFAVRAAAELERKRTEKTIDYMASYDALTGLPNRRLFTEMLNRELAMAGQRKELAVVMFLDLDRFKNINDTLGHAMGDRFLQEVAKRLSGCIRHEDVVARFGGDEFMLLLTGIRNRVDVGRVASKILDCLKPSFTIEGIELHIGSSVGIAMFPEFGSDVETLMKNADTALNRAKELGRNNYQFYAPEMNARTLSQLGMETELRKALERKELVLHFQPQYDVKNHRIKGIEALVRWQHPERGMVAPGDFIPLAEETGLIGPIGKWVLHTACAQNRSWQKAGLEPVRVAVNLSARQFQHRDLPAMVAEVLEETGLEPRYLELEITETIIMNDLEITIDQLIRLMNLGVRISIDDFGTGYSSLAYLKKFPIHTLKIDRSFVKDIGADSDDTAIVSAVIALAHNLKFEVVAEGVETPDQLCFLRSKNCDTVQGFFFSRPLPAEELEHLLVKTAEKPLHEESSSNTAA